MRQVSRISLHWLGKSYLDCEYSRIEILKKHDLVLRVGENDPHVPSRVRGKKDWNVGALVEVGSLYPLRQGDSVYQPAIAVPTERKTAGDFELPRAHLDALIEWLPQVTSNLVIGWRGMEDHFWDFWQHCRPGPRQLHVEVVDINHEQATTVARHLRQMGVSEVVNPSEAHGFTNYIEMLRLR